MSASEPRESASVASTGVSPVPVPVLVPVDDEGAAPSVVFAFCEAQQLLLLGQVGRRRQRHLATARSEDVSGATRRGSGTPGWSFPTPHARAGQLTEWRASGGGALTFGACGKLNAGVRGQHRRSLGVQHVAPAATAGSVALERAEERDRALRRVLPRNASIAGMHEDSEKTKVGCGVTTEA